MSDKVDWSITIRERFQLSDSEYAAFMNLCAMAPVMDESISDFCKSLDQAIDSAPEKVRGTYRILEKEGAV